MGKAIKTIILVVLILLLVFCSLLGAWLIEMSLYSKREKKLNGVEFKYVEDASFLSAIDRQGCYFDTTNLIETFQSSYHVIKLYKEQEITKKVVVQSFYKDAVINGRLYNDINLTAYSPLERSAFLFAGMKPTLLLQKETYKGYGDYWTETIKIHDKKCKIESVGSENLRESYKILIRYHSKEYAFEIEFFIDKQGEFNMEQAYQRALAVSNKLIESFVIVT